MTVPHLVSSGASDYLARGSGDSLRIFQTRVEDAIGHVSASDKVTLIDETAKYLQSMNSVGGRLQVLLGFLDRQRQIVRGEL